MTQQKKESQSLLLSRRSFVLGGAAAAAGMTLGSCLPDVAGQWSDEGQALCSWSEPRITAGEAAHAGQVWEIHDEQLTVGRNVDPVVVAVAMKKLLLAITGQVDLQTAWSYLIPDLAANQIIGIKVNVLNEKVPTHPEVIKALVDSLKEGTGVSSEQILIWDRRLDELTRAGLTADALGALVEGTWETDKLQGAGMGYEENWLCLGGRKSHLSKLLTWRVDHLINVAVAKRHDASGFTACMKNHYGSIDNPGEFHDELVPGGTTVIEKRFEKVIPALNALDEVVNKTRLWLLDAAISVCKGGTESAADCVPNLLVGGLDPVAVDARGKQIRDEQRNANGGLEPDPETISEGWLKAAERVGLGKGTIKHQIVT